MSFEKECKKNATTVRSLAAIINQPRPGMPQGVFDAIVAVGRRLRRGETVRLGHLEFTLVNTRPEAEAANTGVSFGTSCGLGEEN